MEPKMLEMREVFGESLLELGQDYPELVVLDADIAASFRTAKFSSAWPDRHFNFGTAEQNMMMAAAGMSTIGLIPIPCTFASFVLRACDQIRNFICYAKLNVKIIGSHAGIEVGVDGATHQATEDVAILRSLPNMIVVVPADAASLPILLRQLIKMDGPTYLRMVRGSAPVIYGQTPSLRVGQAETLMDGDDVTLIASGRVVSIVMDAAETLTREGIRARVLDMHTIKPLDTIALEKAAIETTAIVTVEDHNIIGGLGGAVAEYLAESGLGRLVRVGIKDVFARSGDPMALYQRYGLSKPHIVDAVRGALAQKVRSAPVA
jgi:transketolase